MSGLPARTRAQACEEARILRLTLVLCLALLAVTSVKLIGESDGENSSASLRLQGLPRSSEVAATVSAAQGPELVRESQRAQVDARHGSMRWHLMRLGDQAVAGGHVEDGRNAYVGVVSTAQDWTALVSQYEWDATAVLVIIAGPTDTCPTGESAGQARAVSPDGQNWGLMQINLVHLGKLEALTGARDPYLLLDPAVNIAVAYEVYLAAAGFSPWACAPVEP